MGGDWVFQFYSKKFISLNYNSESQSERDKNLAKILAHFWKIKFKIKVFKMSSPT